MPIDIPARAHGPAPGHSRRAQGFTLIEIIVVVALVGILATFVRLALGDGGRAARLRDTAALLQQLADAAVEEAVFTSRPVALVFDAGTFELRELREGQWRQRPTDPLYRARPLPPGIEIRVDTGTRQRNPALSGHAPAIFFPDGTAETLPLEVRDPNVATRALLMPAATGYALSYR